MMIYKRFYNGCIVVCMHIQFSYVCGEKKSSMECSDMFYVKKKELSKMGTCTRGFPREFVHFCPSVYLIYHVSSFHKSQWSRFLYKFLDGILHWYEIRYGYNACSVCELSECWSQSFCGTKRSWLIEHAIIYTEKLNVLMYIVDQIKSYFIKTRHTVWVWNSFFIVKRRLCEHYFTDICVVKFLPR